MTLRERIAEALEDFQSAGWRDDWDVSIVAQRILPASRGPGLSVFTLIADGITFETPIEPTDDVARIIGAALH